MKKLLLIAIAVLFFTAFTFKGDDDKRGLGRVQKITGKDVYIHCEPEHPYDVVFEVKVVPFGMTCPSIADMADMVVRKALKISDKEDKPFDAVVIGSGKKDIAIKYK